MTHDHSHDHDDFGGAARDLPRLLSRRAMLTGVVGAGVGAVVLAACGSSATSDTAAASNTAAPSDTAAAATTAAGSATAATDAAAAATSTCATIPTETGGPYPGDGTNGPNILTDSGVVRSDITHSIGSASGVAEGVPLTVKLTIVDSANGCAPLPGASVYLWHATRNGEYSMYSSAVSSENFLRGVQEAGADGTLTFQTVFPGCYDGRWPHIHFEVYNTLADTSSGSTPKKTSQIAMPKTACDVAYAADGYATSITNLAKTSLASDNVFGDGADLQLPAITGDATSGFVASLTVAV